MEGDIEEVEDVLRITRIRISYDASIPSGTSEQANRALETYADKCPAYQSVRGCIDVTWTADFREGALL